MTDDELKSLLRKFKNRYLSNVIINHILQHPEIREDLIGDILEASNNLKNDKINDLLADANLPGYPEHKTFSDCMLSCLDDADRKKLEKFLSLGSRSNPNMIAIGPPDQGKEKLASAIGDYICHRRHSVLYVEYYKLVEIIRTHENIPASNTLYEQLLKTECLIINDFAGIYVDDPDMISSLHILIQERYSEHIKDNNKIRVTFVTTNYELGKWPVRMNGDDIQVLMIINKLLGNGALIKYDECCKNPENAQKSLALEDDLE